MPFKSLFATALLCAASFCASAQDYVPLEQRLNAEQLRATGLDTLSPQQLQLLNQLLREQAPPATPVVATMPAESGHEPDAGRSFIGLDDQPIRSKVKGEVAGWEPGTVFELENGQQWKVLKGSMKLRKPFESPQIVVVPGIAGRWFLQVHEDLPKARVYRID